MIIRKTIDLNEKLTEEQKEMLREAAKRPPVYDEDNPPLTDEQLAQFYRVSEMNREERRKQNVTIRLKPRTIRIAKSLGKGYTGILSRIIEDTLDHPEELEKYL